MASLKDLRARINSVKSTRKITSAMKMVAASKLRGVRITRQGDSRWDDTFDMRVDPSNRTYYWLTGKIDVLDTTDETDVVAVRRNYISVTPIRYELTDERGLKAIRGWKLPLS